MTNSLPTRFNIFRRGIDIESLSCVNCDVGIETNDHLFFACNTAKKISKLINRWWDVPFMDINSYGEWRSWIDNVKLPKKNKSMFQGVGIDAILCLAGTIGVKGRRGLVSPKKGKSDSPKKRQRPFSPRKGWVPMSERLAVMTEDADIVKENPVIVNQKLAAVVKDPLRYSRSVKGKPAGVINKLSLGKSNVSVAKADVVKSSVDKFRLRLENAPDVVNDKSVLTQLENAPDVENSAPDVGKNKNVVADKVDVAKDVVQDDPAKVVKESVAKDKPKGSASFVVVNKDNREGVNDKVLGVVAKYKPKGSVSFVVVPKDNRKESSEKEEKKLNVVSKDKPKSKASELVKIKRKGGPDSDSNSADEEEHSKKKPDRKQKKLKAGLKRKTSGSDALDSSSIDSEVVKQFISQLTKKVKREEFDDESKKGKNKEKQLTAEEAAYQEYLSKFPAFHARTTPDIGFSSLNNVAIDKLPMKLGRFVVSMFKNYKLSFDTGDQIEVTHSKIHDILGIPVGGNSLFNLVERETGDEFVKKWAAQFSPKELKQIRVNDIARILVGSKEIDFLFKVNFLTLFTNTMCKADGLKGEICLDVVKRLREDTVISQIDWCGYVYDCLRDSKLPNGTNNYLGPLTFLILLYLDSTNFESVPVVRTRPAIKSWTSYLMKQRQELELKKRVVGLLPINSDWTKAEMEEAEGFIVSAENSEKEDFFKKAEEKLSLICAERVMLEEYMRKARLENPGDGKFIGLHEKYFNLFKDPISFEDDGNENNVGDDDANDGDGNVDENDANECDKNPNGSNQSFGFNKISLDDFGNDSGPTESEPVDPTKQGTVVDVNTAEEGENTVENCGIMSSPEEFTQWLNKNVNLVGEACDSIVAEYLHGDLFGDNSAAREALNEVVTPQIQPTQKRVVKPSSYVLSPYMNKKTNVVPKITKLEFIVGNSLFDIQGDKLKTKENFYDCGIFTMLHMENFNGGPASDFDCGLPVESQLQLDILRRLRFKFATKILLHEINLQSEKMVEFAKEFDKKGPSEKISIIIDAIKNREERDRIDN
ncbi:peptidase C48, SUMO/sentrin/Ubl1 [Tanacetum coccineum]